MGKPTHAVAFMVLTRLPEERAIMKISTSKGMAGLRAAALALLFGAFLTGPVAAQQEPEPALLAQEVDPAVVEEDEGFDDWGLLGLLGLAGLAGLMKRNPEPVVHTELDRDRPRV
jgi:hypothetical protein